MRVAVEEAVVQQLVAMNIEDRRDRTRRVEQPWTRNRRRGVRAPRQPRARTPRAVALTTPVGCVQAILTLLQQEPKEWKEAQVLLADPKMLRQLALFERDFVSAATLKEMQKYSDLDPEVAGKVSAGAQSLCIWVLAMSTPPSSVLFVGNSLTYFNDGVPAQVAALRECAAAGSALDVKMCVQGGADLRKLWRKTKAKQEKKMRDSRRPTGVVSIELTSRRRLGRK